jgi:hypothetical protein
VNLFIGLHEAKFGTAKRRFPRWSDSGGEPHLAGLFWPEYSSVRATQSHDFVTCLVGPLPGFPERGVLAMDGLIA